MSGPKTTRRPGPPGPRATKTSNGFQKRDALIVIERRVIVGEIHEDPDGDLPPVPAALAECGRYLDSSIGAGNWMPVTRAAVEEAEAHGHEDPHEMTLGFEFAGFSFEVTARNLDR